MNFAYWYHFANNIELMMLEFVVFLAENDEMNESLFHQHVAFVNKINHGTHNTQENVFIKSHQANYK